MEPCIKCILLLQLIFGISPIFCGGPIIELDRNYNRIAPWKDLMGLGLEHLEETDCLRECVKGARPRVCMQTFVLEYYAAMGTACKNCSRGVLKDCYLPQCIIADRFERGVMSINRQIPGPAIHVCHNDLIVINVKNKMEGTAAAIHWHGILQKHSQWMDGVPFVTQCPFGVGSFRYIFPVDDVGTMLYHGHSGLQKVNGQFGPLIVRRPRCDDPWDEDVYDCDQPDHIIMITDWIHDNAEMFFPGLPTRSPGISPTTVLVNGIGRYKNSSDPKAGVDKNTPLATFHVEPYKRYRFRIIASGSMWCPFQIQIEDHDMTIIATDSFDVEPRTVNTLIVYSGERYDVVIDTRKPHRGKKAFWIHILAVGVCEIFKLDQYAVLSYGTNENDIGIFPIQNPPTIDHPLPIYTRINHGNAVCGASPTDLCITELHHIGNAEDYQMLNAEPDVRLRLEIGMPRFNIDYLHRKGNYQTFVNLRQDVAVAGTINGISSMFPMSMMLRNRDSDADFCNSFDSPTSHHDHGSGSGNATDTPHRECTHVIRVKQGAIVEMVLRDSHGAPNGANHPFHMHGNPYYVMKITQGENMNQNHTTNDNHHCSCKQPGIPVTENNQCSCKKSQIPVTKNHQCTCKQPRIPVTENHQCSCKQPGIPVTENHPCSCKQPRIPVAENHQCSCKQPRIPVTENHNCTCKQPRIPMTENHQCSCKKSQIPVTKNHQCSCKQPRIPVTENHNCTCKQPRIPMNENHQCSCKQPRIPVAENHNCTCKQPRIPVTKNHNCTCKQSRIPVAENHQCSCKQPRIPVTENHNCTCKQPRIPMTENHQCSCKKSQIPVTKNHQCSCKQPRIPVTENHNCTCKQPRIPMTENHQCSCKQPRIPVAENHNCTCKQPRIPVTKNHNCTCKQSRIPVAENHQCSCKQPRIPVAENHQCSCKQPRIPVTENHNCTCKQSRIPVAENHQCSCKQPRIPVAENHQCSCKQPRIPVTENLWGRKRILVPRKDTVAIPGGGSVVLRWKAKNPGDWMLHCHLDWHMAMGMMMFFRVEGYIPPPPPGFPRCDDFDPLMPHHMNH